MNISTQFFIKLDDTLYQQGDMQDLLNGPYDFISSLSFEEAKKILLLFENNE